MRYSEQSGYGTIKTVL